MTATIQRIPGQLSLILASAMGGLHIEIVPRFFFAASQLSASLILHMKVQSIHVKLFVLFVCFLTLF